MNTRKFMTMTWSALAVLFVIFCAASVTSAASQASANEYSVGRCAADLTTMLNEYVSHDPLFQPPLVIRVKPVDSRRVVIEMKALSTAYLPGFQPWVNDSTAPFITPKAAALFSELPFQGVYAAECPSGGWTTGTIKQLSSIILEAYGNQQTTDFVIRYAERFDAYFIPAMEEFERQLSKIGWVPVYLRAVKFYEAFTDDHYDKLKIIAFVPHDAELCKNTAGNKHACADHQRDFNYIKYIFLTRSTISSMIQLSRVVDVSGAPDVVQWRLDGAAREMAGLILRDIFFQLTRQPDAPPSLRSMPVPSIVQGNSF